MQIMREYMNAIDSLDNDLVVIALEQGHGLEVTDLANSVYWSSVPIVAKGKAGDSPALVVLSADKTKLLNQIRDEVEAEYPDIEWEKLINPTYGIKDLSDVVFDEEVLQSIDWEKKSSLWKS